MGTGFRGTFVISWSQAEIDGLKTATPSSLTVGATWSWQGDAVRVDGPTSILRLDQADGEADIRKRAGRMVRRLVGAPTQNIARPDTAEVDAPLSDGSFVLTDGRQSYTATLIEVGDPDRPLMMFLDELPPKGRDLWVVHHTIDARRGYASAEQASGVICFTPGTRILTPYGVVPIEWLREGDLVQTKDNGATALLAESEHIAVKQAGATRPFALDG